MPPQLEKNHVVPTAWQDEALARDGVSREAFIPYSKAKFACYSRCFLTSYFFILVPYNEKDIFFVCLF